MLLNAYLLAKIGADTPENERNFAEILPKTGNYPTAMSGTSSQASANLAADEHGRGAAARRRAQDAVHVEEDHPGPR